MRKLYVLLFCVSANLWAQAQDPKEISGNYYIEGITDGAKSGFYLNSNHTFNFFYSKNGIDRYGSGRWYIEKNAIVFSGRLKPARIYQLLSSRRVNDNFVTIQFTDDNPALVKNIECTLFTERGRQKLFTKDDGAVKFTKQIVDSIQIRSLVFPDHPFTFVPSNKIQNSFEFGFEKAAFEVFFDNFMLLYTNNMLVGQHPLLRGQFRYVKDNQ
ncbi:MAG: hypothetical protein KIT80_04675 [Chitinophagaceae bacterium]|nr:hypothetical protein [Chitinophagaceae bacterium]MCW5926186.1 hypothetical protein [Chitinophagaceae bacterium]